MLTVTDATDQMSATAKCVVKLHLNKGGLLADLKSTGPAGALDQVPTPVR